LAITAGKTSDELVREYPISSGSAHRQKEDALEDIFSKWQAAETNQGDKELLEFF